MKSRLLLIPTILATTAGFVSGNAVSSQPDAQAQAAALLSRAHTFVSEGAPDQRNASSQSAAVDAHAHAAALLSGLRTEQEAKPWVRITPSRAARTSLDAQAQAAALLSGSRITVSENARITATSEKLGEHPAVLVAQTWSTRGIDPNTFIVAHPARLQLIAASPTEKDAQRGATETIASTEPTQAQPTRENSRLEDSVSRMNFARNSSRSAVIFGSRRSARRMSIACVVPVALGIGVATATDKSNNDTIPFMHVLNSRPTRHFTSGAYSSAASSHGGSARQSRRRTSSRPA